MVNFKSSLNQIQTTTKDSKSMEQHQESMEHELKSNHISYFAVVLVASRQCEILCST
jgi:hypothetical protein